MVRQTCKGCGKPRVLGPDFYTDRDGLPRIKCKACHNAESEAWRRANPQRHRANVRRVNHRIHLLRRYGLSVEDFDALVAQSDGRCSICKEHETRKRRLSLDHDHETGRLRGFLCSRCNLLIGNARDSVALLKMAVAYLSAPPLRVPTVGVKFLPGFKSEPAEKAGGVT